MFTLEGKLTFINIDQNHLKKYMMHAQRCIISQMVMRISRTLVDKNEKLEAVVLTI